MVRVNGASPLRQVISGASIGNAVEWYDFAFYVIVAAVVSLVVVLTLQESAGRPLPGTATAEVAVR